MNRCMTLTACVLMGALAAVSARGDDPPEKLSSGERNELLKQWGDLTDAGRAAYEAGKYPEAEKAFRAALDAARRLYPAADYPNGHAKLATSLANVGLLCEVRGNYPDAERFSTEALAMKRRLFKGDSTTLAASLNNLASCTRPRGSTPAPSRRSKRRWRSTGGCTRGPRRRGRQPEQLGGPVPDPGQAGRRRTAFQGRLDMTRRLVEGDHPRVVVALNNLAVVYKSQGKYTDAEPLCNDALAMMRRLVKGDHPDLASCINNLGSLYAFSGKYAAAEALLKDASDMRRRLFKGDHPIVADSLNNLGHLYKLEGNTPTPSGSPETRWTCTSGCSRATTPTSPTP